MSSQPTWITPAGSQGTYPEGQLLSIQFQAIPADQSQGRVANILLGQMNTITITNPGAGYSVTPQVTITRNPLDTGLGAGAAAVAAFSQVSGTITGLTISNYGNNYTLPPIVTIAPPTTGSITSVIVNTPGSLYTERPLVTVTTTTGINFTATTSIDANVSGITINAAGANYEWAPAIDIYAGDNKIRAEATATILAAVDYVEVLVSAQYSTAPIVIIAGGGGAGATADAILDDNGYLTAIIVTAAGSNYSTEPTVLVDGQEAVARAHIRGSVNNIILTEQGTEYTLAPTVVITGGAGTGATATAFIGDGQVQGFSGFTGGSGYKAAPAVTFVGGGVNTAGAVATVKGNIAAVSVTALGSGYTQANTSITFTGGGGSGAAATAVINAAGELVDITLTNPGINYTSEPTVNVVTTDAGALGAAAQVRLQCSIDTVVVYSAGNEYKDKPLARAQGGMGAGARLTPTIQAVVTSVNVITPGTGYLAAPSPAAPIINIVRAQGDTTGTGATAQAVVTSTTATAITTTNKGLGYSTVPKVTITPAPGDTTGTGATAVAYISNSEVAYIQVIDRGAGYTLNPIVTVEAPVEITKLTVTATNNSATITLNNTVNLYAGMIANIAGTNYKIISVSSPNITITTPVTLVSGSLIYFTGITATPTSIIEPTPVVYNLQSGSLPLGINSNPVRLTTSGLLTGIPQEVSETTVSEFTIRARDTLGNIRDRVFSVGIQGPDVPVFLTAEGLILSISDSTWVSFQMLYITPDPVDVVITIDNGALPEGLYIDARGLITGYAIPPVDAFGTPITVTSTFTLRATKLNTTQSSTRTFSIIVANQDESLVTYNHRVPAILNNNPLTPTHTQADPYFDFYFSGTSLGTYKHDNYFAYKIIGYDFDAAGGAIQNGVITKITVTTPGTGYVTPPTVVIRRNVSQGDSTGYAGAAYALISGGAVTAVIITNGGYNYTAAPIIEFKGGLSSGGVAATAVSSTDSISVVNPGLGYVTAPLVTIGAPDFNGTQAGATAVLDTQGRVARIITNAPGTGYTALPTITVAPPAPIVKTVTPAVSTNTITLTDTTNLVPGLTVTINSVVHTIITVNAGVSVVVDGAAVSIPDMTEISFIGQQAQASCILSIQYALEGLSNINQYNPNISTQLNFNPFTGWLSGYLPNLGSKILTFQLTAYVTKGNLITTAYKYNITVQGNINTAIDWLNQDTLVGTLYNGEISYLSVAATSATNNLEYRLAPLITKTLNSITWGAITAMASTTTDTTGLATVYVDINPGEIAGVKVGSTCSGPGVTQPYPTVAEVDFGLNRIRLSEPQAIALGADLTFTTNAYVAVGNDGIIQYSLVTQNTWYPANTSDGSDYSTLANFTGVTWLPTVQQFIAVGDLSGKPVLYTSSTAVDWQQSNQPFNYAFTDVTVGYPGGLATIVAVAKSGKIFFGTNSAALLTVSNSGTTADISSVIWDDYNDQYVIVGVTGYVATSPNGTTWTAQTVRFPGTYGQKPGYIPPRPNPSPVYFTPSSAGGSFSFDDLAAAPTGSVYSVRVVTGGTNYTKIPEVVFSGDGAGASATAVLGTGLTAGRVVAITINSTGTGYTTPPLVTIIPAPGDVTGAGATAQAFTRATLIAVGTVRWTSSSADIALLVASTDGGVTWLAQPVYSDPISIGIPGFGSLATIETPLLSVTANPERPGYWIIGSTAGRVITGTNDSATDIKGTSNPQNNIPPDSAPGAWVFYDLATPYSINKLWSRPLAGSIVDTPNILSCGTVGIIQESTTALDQYTWASINVQSLPHSLTLLTSGDISGRVAFVPTDVDVAVGTKSRYEFVVQAYDISNRDVSTTRSFAIDVVKLWQEPFETLYIEALPAQRDRSIIANVTATISSITTTPTSTESVIYRPADPYYGVSQRVIYQHEFGVYASSLEEYIQAEQKNHYWRNLVLGELQVARALDPNGNPLYEVVYSLIQDDLVNPQTNQSVSLEITWPEVINLNLGSWYDSILYQFDSYVYGVASFLRTTSGCTNNVIIPLNSTSGIEIGMVMTGTGVTNAQGSIQKTGKRNGDGDPSVVAVNQYSVTVNVAQTLAPNTTLRFQTPTYYTARTPGSAQVLYPDSLPNMRTRIQENLGRNTSDTILPRWMTSQQTNGNTLGYVAAYVLCYVKPGYGDLVKNTLQANTALNLNQIDFRIDRFEVDKSATYNWDNSLLPPNWRELPSSGVTSITDQIKDYYVLFPQKTILPR